MGTHDRYSYDKYTNILKLQNWSTENGIELHLNIDLNNPTNKRYITELCKIAEMDNSDTKDFYVIDEDSDLRISVFYL